MYTKYIGPLATAHAYIFDDGQNMAECIAAGQPKLDLLNQLRGCIVDIISVIPLFIRDVYILIAEKYIGLLEATHAHIYVDLFVMVECGIVGQPVETSSGYLRSFSFATIYLRNLSLFENFSFIVVIFLLLYHHYIINIFLLQIHLMNNK